MGQTLEALHRLQAIERQLAEIRRDREVKERRVNRQNRQLQKTEESLGKSKVLYQERRRRLDALQLDVAAREESVNKHRQALNTAKTNKEYAAILTAMNTEKADNSKLETEILQLMEETQTLEKEAVKIEEEKMELEEGAAQAEQVLKAFDKKIKPQKEGLLTQRAEYSEGVPPTTLTMFTRVAERHDGEALAEVMRLHPKRDDHICAGCNLKITLEIVNILKTKDDIQICKVCGRILYLEGAT